MEILLLSNILGLLIILFVSGSSAINFTKLENVSYGSNKEQVMDIHTPTPPPGNLTKVLILIHGRAWNSGSKEDMNLFIPNLIKEFPACLIANVNYRLGSWSDPGYPKQLEDIETAIKFLRTNRSKSIGKDAKIGLIGENSGGHLALLYAYKTDNNKSISAVGNIGGPVDFTDPNYRNSLLHNLILFSFIGPKLFVLYPNLYKEISPLTYATSNSTKLPPPTISIFGSNAPIVPESQKTKLQKALDKIRVPNEEYEISSGAFANWTEIDRAYAIDRLVHFFDTYL